MKQQIEISQNELDKLLSDYIKLYEKIKLVQIYPIHRLFSLEMILFPKSFRQTTHEVDDSIDRYSRGYDASLIHLLIPLNKYAINECLTGRMDCVFVFQKKQKKYESLKLHEKFAFNFGQFILVRILIFLVDEIHFEYDRVHQGVADAPPSH